MSIERIVISGENSNQVFEDLVGVAHTPGDLLMIASGKTQRHGTAGGVAQGMFAVRNINSGKTIDDDYIADETGRRYVAQAGETIYAWLADGVAVVDGVTKLISNGDGSLKLASGTDNDMIIVGVSQQTQTASGKTRCKIQAA